MSTVPQPISEEKADKRVFLTVRIPKSLDRAVERLAMDRDCSKQSLIELALRRLLSEEQSAA